MLTLSCSHSRGEKECTSRSESARGEVAQGWRSAFSLLFLYLVSLLLLSHFFFLFLFFFSSFFFFLSYWLFK